MQISKVFTAVKVIGKQYAPEILLGVGILAGVGSTIFAVKATTHVEEVIEEHNGKVEEINITAHEKSELYSSMDAKKDMLITYGQTSVELLKLYWPSLTLGVVSVGCVLSSHGLMKQRNLAVLAAYKALEETYAGYRNRVRSKIGEEAELAVHRGLGTTEVTTTDSKGKTKTKKVQEQTNDKRIYQFTFGPNTSKYWKRGQHANNLVYLKTAQNYLNDLMWSRVTDTTHGYISLNEALEYLGMDTEKESYGLVVGWSTAAGDARVDFGVFDAATGEPSGSFNDRDILDMSIPLDFNCVGSITDLVRRKKGE